MDNKSNKLRRTTTMSKRSTTKKYYTKLSSTLIRNQSNEKRKKLMKVIIAATAQAAAVCSAAAISDNDSSNHSNNFLFNNLVRIKRFHHLNNHHVLNKNKKKNNSFRIQKNYRFNRISRLRCIRLRQTQLKEKRRRNQFVTKNKSKRAKKVKKSSNVSSSCAESSDSNQNSNNNLVCKHQTNSSCTSSNEDTLSLVECFNQTKFLNSSDTREEDDESKRDSKKKQNTIKKNINKINCIKPKKISFKKKLHRLGYLNLKKTQLFCDCHYCNFKPVTKTTSTNTEKLNKIYLKRKRLIKQDETEAKKIKCDSCLSPSLSSILSSGDENTSRDDLIDSSIKSDDTNDESTQSFDLKTKLKPTRFKSKSFSGETTNITMTTTIGQAIDLKQSSSDDDLDDTGADDEQSDWPGNENNLCMKLKTKLNAPLSDLTSDEFKVIPWWNNQQMEQDNEQILKLNKKKQSNYEKLNDESDNSEFDHLLSGALGVMSASSRKAYKMKLKQNKQRSTNSLTQNYISTKSSADLDSLITDSAAASLHKPIGEDNKGNKMLQQMGWTPGTSLGSKSNETNLINPIIPIKRPNRIGLGFTQN